MRNNGFTLIELSIVLVIIGLVVGGILTGRDLIRAASERAQISQIEKYNQAVNAFFEKYGALPGDLNASVANAFGFTPRGSYPGQGDGNGVIWGTNGSDTNVNGFCEVTGEDAMVWVDLTTANGLKVNMIDGSFSTALPASGSDTSNIKTILPAAKIGRENYIYVYSDPRSFGANGGVGPNYWGLSVVTRLLGGCGTFSYPGLTVREAFDIDTKVDDGLPQLGNVKAVYANNNLNNAAVTWAAGGTTSVGGFLTGSTNGASDTSATPASSATCYDNNNAAGAVQKYSVQVSDGSNMNCALSFKMQAGD